MGIEWEYSRGTVNIVGGNQVGIKWGYMEYAWFLVDVTHQQTWHAWHAMIDISPTYIGMI